MGLDEEEEEEGGRVQNGVWVLMKERGRESSEQGVGLEGAAEEGEREREFIMRCGS